MRINYQQMIISQNKIEVYKSKPVSRGSLHTCKNGLHHGDRDIYQNRYDYIIKTCQIEKRKTCVWLIEQCLETKEDRNLTRLSMWSSKGQ